MSFDGEEYFFRFGQICVGQLIFNLYSLFIVFKKKNWVLLIRALKKIFVLEFAINSVL